MRLTKTMRTAILNKIIEEVRIPRKATLARHEHALALRLATARFGEDVFERCRELPPGWLEVHKKITLDSVLYNILPRIKTDKSYYRYFVIELAEYAVLPNSFGGTWTRKDLGSLFDEVYQYFQDVADLDFELANLATQTTAVLASFTTVEKLAGSWPEGYAKLPQELLAQTGGVPAPRIEDLNKCIAALKEAA